MKPAESITAGPARGPEAPTPLASYADLKRRIKQRGLLEKQPRFLALKIAVNLALLGLGIALLFLNDSLWLQMPNAVFMAFVFGQIAFVAHDVGHRQAFRTPRVNDRVGLLHANLLLGMSFGWWVDKHNRHHANTNIHDHDPDIDIPVLAFSEEDALEKRGLFRLIVKHQAVFFFPMLLFQAWSLRVGSIRYLLQHDSKRRTLEAVLLALHAILFTTLAIAALGPLEGILFLLVQQALFGFYLASVFAPNHKGMPVLEPGQQIDFLRHQVLTSRNVRPHPLADLWYGGLNYQVEHHLFPTLARNKLREAREIVKQFCEQHGIAYHETSMTRSYAEILQHLHQVSAPLRMGR